ncbi:putative quinol monooxygenase [Spirosoma radiotolerans]|uniref:Antibiotic biosynthesis monooxygenase n=1 Tax=Spirosoma radiotolerans TaxID=1379870 RepID=A0A0E3ZTI3_9BACT|nr:putative quinol monooxygenase [Spirosoma radiotolerans]AKD54635.1 antibiotic biosynthesis monooxygenase [Spirosoma radiotolerans]
MPLLVFAEITAKAGAETNLKNALHELVLAVRTEPACQLYELYESTEHPERFIMHERWDDEAGLQAHNQMAHMKTFGEKAKDWLAGPAALTKVTI